MRKICKCGSTLAVCLMLFGATATQAGTISGSKHDMSQTGNLAFDQLCVYCHTPHNASQQAGLSEAPLWNRKITNLDAFIPYSSPSMTQTCPSTPSGISLACLSCHDGTQADAAPGGANPGANGQSAVVGQPIYDQHNVLNNPKSGGTPGGPACSGACHTGTYNGIYSQALSVMAGPDLRNDHPISMPYPTANTNFFTPPDAVKGWGDVKLFNGKVECPTCHNPHDPDFVPFLRASNDGSALCLRCHNK